MIPQSKSEPQVLVIETTRFFSESGAMKMEPFSLMNADERVCEFPRTSGRRLDRTRRAVGKT
jgi:hypothetical protein